MSRRLLVAGCGDLGQRMARRAGSADWAITGLRRSSGKGTDMEIVAGDLQGRLDSPALQGHWDVVVYTATPDERTPAGYRRNYVNGLENLLARVDIGRLVFVSSTAVYGQDDGEWVDEASETRPKRFNGQVLLEAEAVAAGHPDSVVVRFSGIYGPGREYLVRSLKAGKARCRQDPPQWTNRIHAEDCAAFLLKVAGMARPDPVYCATDSRPAPRCEVLDWLAGELNLPRPDRMAADEVAGQGRRVRNRRMLAAGHVLEYPDYRHGYQELVREAE